MTPSRTKIFAPSGSLPRAQQVVFHAGQCPHCGCRRRTLYGGRLAPLHQRLILVGAQAAPFHTFNVAATHAEPLQRFAVAATHAVPLKTFTPPVAGGALYHDASAAEADGLVHADAPDHDASAAVADGRV